MLNIFANYVKEHCRKMKNFVLTAELKEGKFLLIKKSQTNSGNSFEGILNYFLGRMRI